MVVALPTSALSSEWGGWSHSLTKLRIIEQVGQEGSQRGYIKWEEDKDRQEALKCSIA